MEVLQDNNNQKVKSKVWLYFMAGIAVGFVLSISIYIIDKKFFPEHVILSKTIEHIYHPNEENGELEAYNGNSAKNNKRKVSSVSCIDSLAVDSLSLNNEYEEEYSEVDFMMEDYDDEMVSEDKILANKRVKVHFAENDTLQKSAQSNEYFLVEQWSSPIKNRTSYHRDNNILKVKGIDIAKVSIYRINGDYYLQNGSHYYILNNNDSYEKLSEVNISQLK